MFARPDPYLFQKLIIDYIAGLDLDLVVPVRSELFFDSFSQGTLLFRLVLIVEAPLLKVELRRVLHDNACLRKQLSLPGEAPVGLF